MVLFVFVEIMFVGLFSMLVIDLIDLIDYRLFLFFSGFASFIFFRFFPFFSFLSNVDRPRHQQRIKKRIPRKSDYRQQTQ